jgi:GH15 family glucan-1,4-alpha-glucosidase
VDIILSGQSDAGAYAACPSYPVYCYSWLRDGSFSAESMSRAGHRASATAFFDWCAGVITDRAGRINSLLRRSADGGDIPSDDLLPARYRLDGTDADDAAEQWWNFQLDGYGMWLWAAGLHVKRHGLDPHRWAAAITLTVRYLNRFWHLPCYDWWEEHREHRHTSTLAAIYAGLSAAIGLDVLSSELAEETIATCAQIRKRIRGQGVHQGRLAKWLGGSDTDASLIACFTPFGIIPAEDPIAHATITAIEQSIAHGGVHRYPADTFYGGGEWPLLAALLGWHYARTGRTGKAWQQLRWIAAQANTAGDLPEQTSGHLLHPAHHQEWTDRWGPVATPLLWSHAMFLILATELSLDLSTPGNGGPLPYPEQDRLTG